MQVLSSQKYKGQRPKSCLSSSCLETPPTAAPPSPSSLNLPIAPALEHGLAAGKQLHFEKVLPSPRNAKDDIMLNPGQTKEATSACPSHAAPRPRPLHMRGLTPNLPRVCPVPAVGEAAHAASFPTLVPTQTTDPHGKRTVVVMQGKRQR